MASGPSVAAAIEMLDQELGSDIDVRLWTVAPNFDGTGGTQVTGGGYAPVTPTFNPAVAGTGGQIAKATTVAGCLFSNMPVASSAVVAISFHRHSTGVMRAVNRSWTSPTSWSAGDSPLINITVPFVPAS